MSKISTVPQVAKNNPAFTEPSVRWHVFNAAHNGLAESGALIRMGRRVLIDEEKFIEWVKSHNGKRAA